jgi:hypothetical protein
LCVLSRAPLHWQPWVNTWQAVMLYEEIELLLKVTLQMPYFNHINIQN